MIITKDNKFAVLVDETQFAEFKVKLKQHKDLTYVFLITDSEEAFQEMSTQLEFPHIIQLYRDYLENFTINKGEIL